MTVLTHQAQNAGTSTANTTTLAIVGLTATVPVGDTAFVVVAGTAATATCADNSANAGAANVWTQDGVMNSAGVRVWVFRSNTTRSLSTGNTITITFSTATARKAGVVFSTHGWVTPAAVERSATASGTTSPMSTGTTTATLSVDEFVLAAYGVSTTTMPTVTDTSGMTRGSIATALLTGVAKAATYSWKETSATGTQAGSATVSPVTDWAGLVLTYPAAPSGTAFTKTITGAASFSGVRPSLGVQRKAVAGLSFSGAEVAHPTARRVTAGFAPSGALSRQLSLVRTLAAALSFGGARSSATAYARSLAGAVFTPTATNTRVKAVSKAVAGALSFAGAVSRLPQKMLTGALQPTGATTSVSTLLRTLTATLQPVGALKRSTSRKLSAAALSAAQFITSQASNRFSAVFRPTGAPVTHGLPARTLFAALQITTSMARVTTRQLVSSLIASGVMNTQYIPPVAPTPPGGGGFGAVMDDSFFVRYQVDGKWRGVKRVKA